MAVCSSCKNEFNSSELIVLVNGIICEKCAKEVVKQGEPLGVTLHLQWHQALALESILKDEINVDALEIKPELIEILSKEILRVLRSVITSHGG